MMFMKNVLNTSCKKIYVKQSCVSILNIQWMSCRQEGHKCFEHIYVRIVILVTTKTTAILNI